MPAPRFNIEYTDGRSEEVKLLPKAQLAFEKETGKSLGEDFGGMVSDLYLLAWFAAGSPDGSMDNWIENVEAVSGVDNEEGDEGDDPKAPSTESSPN